MELKMLRGRNWLYFQVGKYWLDEHWWEIRIAFDFYTRRIHLSFTKIFEEGKLSNERGRIGR